MSVNHSAGSEGIIETYFLFFFNIKVYCVLSLESPHRGDSNVYTQFTVLNLKKKKKKSPGFILNLQPWDFSKGIKNEFETAVVNEPSVFEPLKFYCIFSKLISRDFVEAELC